MKCKHKWLVLVLVVCILSLTGCQHSEMAIRSAKENHEAEEMPSFEEVLGMDIHKLTEAQLNELGSIYREIEEFTFKEDGSNEAAYFALMDDFDMKRIAFDLDVPFSSYLEVANKYMDQIQSEDYNRLIKLSDSYNQLMETQFDYEDLRYTQLVKKIESIFNRNGLPAEEITTQVENRSVHYGLYEVENGQLRLSVDSVVDEDEMTLEERKLHEKMWLHIVKIIPKAYMPKLVKFEVNTDGIDNVMAHVVEETDDYAKWRLAIDLKDALTPEGEITSEFTHTVVHEFAHVMTLHKGELQGEKIIDKEAYETQEGYLKTESYLNQFYQRFWLSIAQEHQVAADKDAEISSGDALYAFYEKYADQFVSDYAATNPGEDIAETYRVFVMEDKPTGKTIRDQKILFMYDFKELMKIRLDIRQALNMPL